MKVLVVNCGSSSVKYQLFESDTEDALAKGIVERIGEARQTFKHQSNGREVAGETDAPDHETAFRKMVELLASPEHGVIASHSEIEAVGHRVVHGGERFVASALIDDGVIAGIEANAALAPLHNPPNLTGIRAAMRVFPGARHTAVFDTSFHQHMPKHAYLYALPYEYYEDLGVRRYGFHGTSHRYVSQRAAELLGADPAEFKCVTVHLGNGCSVAAVDGGRSIDTSMGLTPLEGLVMGTRCGDIDPAIVLYLQKRLDKTPEELDAILNKQSGVLGLTGTSNDMRALEEAADAGDERAALARSVFAYRVRKYVGAYMAALNGADAIVFTGGIGEKDPKIRAQTVGGMEALGLDLNEQANAETFGEEGEISKVSSRVKILVVPTNEEIIIARDAAELARKRSTPPRKAPPG